MRRRQLEFKVAGRYGYYAVDVYDKKTGGMLTTAIAGVTRKEAEIIAGQMANVQSGYFQRLAKSADEIISRQNQERKLKKVI